MKFLLINYEYPPIGAGAATATQAIAKNLCQLGHEVTVLTARYGELPAVQNEEGVTVRRVKCRRRYADRCTIAEMTSFVVSALLALPSIMKASRANAVIAFFSIPCGPIALLAKVLFHMPYVISLRGGDVPGLVPEIAWVHRLLGPIRRAALKYATAVVANANGLRELSEANDPVKVRVIPNGVDAEFFQPALQANAIANQPFRIVFTGRLQTQKNVALLLEEFAALRASAAIPVELHLVGDGPLRAELQQQADSIGLNGSVKWHGWNQREQLRRLYQQSDCFVNPSFYEGMPNAVLEAMACAKPVVASGIAGHNVLVRDGENGFLFSLDDHAALRNCLRRLIDDRARAVQMGQNGRQLVEREFSWRRVAAAYVDLFAAPNRLAK
ncbi:MAG TPA: glycosyltransferase family 4 protein [Chthoniobacterales bacterium]|nr:glycosyltransferase family 4 protein [Chthoniobacterales bacterium]